MKLQFEPNQQYQLDAIQAVVDVFAGQPKDEGGAIVGGQGELNLEGRQLELEAVSARGNNLSLKQDQIIRNTHEIQKKNGLELSKTYERLKTARYDDGTTYGSGAAYGPSPLELEYGNNFSIEMETGTGKTYVYLRTIHELYQRYGWKKFIIVVPSVAIREGVLKNLDITREHFAELYNKPEMNHYVWDSKKTGQAREFATNDTLQIMVITIDSFAKAKNIMNKHSDYGRPLDFIKATNPIVVIDEPQNMETDTRRKAIASLNPLCTLRYSATHKHAYNMLYRLTPVDAYDKGLVKKIEVHSVLSEDSYNSAYMSLLELGRKNKTHSFAKIELDKGEERGLQRKVVKVAPGDDLAQITKRSVYEGYVVEAIDHGEKAIEFSNGKMLYVGQKDESLHEEIMKRQIELTVEDHFEKQKQLNAGGVKVLSLFFIDRVANYREYTESGQVKGKFAQWFEKAYAKISANPKYAGVMDGLRAEDVHNGYFAADKSGRWKDSKDTKGEGGKTKDDDHAYELIMKDKERLLDMNQPLRFIFSHSALREGWDSPNVFNICTLNETSSEMKKRQEIGRGLRLPVNAEGERVRDESVNVLTVVANESYADFSRKLQTEIEDETGISFAGRVKNRDDRKRVKLTKNLALDPSFKELWSRIKHKTTYSVNIDTGKLVERAAELLEETSISKPQIATTKIRIEKMDDGKGGAELKSRETHGLAKAANVAIDRTPDILSAIQSRTLMTRNVIFDVLEQSDMFGKVPTNPQQVIDEVSLAINRAKNQLAVDGIKYERAGDSYDMQLFENKELETYLYDTAAKSGAVMVGQPDKTVYDYVSVDSEIEYNFMKALESADNIKFYVKLPNWFKIDTPLGTYNPDWAIAFEDEDKVYFVAETKGTDDANDLSLGQGQQLKIKTARQHFKILNVPYAAPARTLSEALRKVVSSGA